MFCSHKSGFLPAMVIFYTLFTFAAMVCAGTYSGGAGTKEDPYRISTADDLIALGQNTDDYDRHFVVAADIDLGAYYFTTAVVAPDGWPLFTGIFDGVGHKIINLHIDTISDEDSSNDGNDFLGLMGRIGEPGEVKNISVEQSTITVGNASWYLGGLCGTNSGVLRNCSVECRIVGGFGSHYFGGLCGWNAGNIENSGAKGVITAAQQAEGLGGLCGYNLRGKIINCRAAGHITGGIQSLYLGGLCGFLREGEVSRCCAAVSIEGGDSSKFLGGVCGWNDKGCIRDCYASGSVSGGNMCKYLGGLCGYLDHGEIDNSYSVGRVSGGSIFGGLCGSNRIGEIFGSFWDTETSGQTTSFGGTGKTTAEMKTLSTFTEAGWDFVGESANGTADVWRMCGDGVDYPRLAWEFIQGGDISCPDGVGLDDLLVLVGHWMAGTPATVGAADVNKDGKVDLADFGIVASNWMRE